MNLATILTRLKEQPRPLSEEENLYLLELGQELRRAGNDAARWRILEREGLTTLDGFDFDAEVIRKLEAIRRAAMA
jgi:hypothetical protein